MAAVANGMVVTGLVVDAGATLTLPGNSSGNAEVNIDGDININGIVNTTATGGYLGVWSYDRSLTIGTTGKVDGTVSGGPGNGVYLFGNYLVNQGTVTAKGDAGQAGGSVDLESSYYTVNTGTLDASGGDNSSGAGGAAGWAELESDYGNCYSSGDIHAKGGAGVNGDGGDAYANGGVYIYATDQDSNDAGINGDVVVGGTIDVSGGSATNGNGGSGGYVDIETETMGNMTINAVMNGVGGSSTGPGYSGGSGGELYIESDNYASYDPNPGTIQLAGQYNFSGGNGDGDAYSNDPYIEIESNGFNGEGVGSPVKLYGFGSIKMDAGNGGTAGGSAWYEGMYLYTYSGDSYATGYYLPASPITFQPDLYNRGGNDAVGIGNYGGDGGYVDIEAGEDGYYDSNTLANVSGNLYLTGGSGDTGGSNAYAYIGGETVTNSGNITADGGAGVTTGGTGGYIELYSVLINTNNTGTLSVAGGTGGVTNGTAGTIYLDGLLQ